MVQSCRLQILGDLEEGPSTFGQFTPKVRSRTQARLLDAYFLPAGIQTILPSAPGHSFFSVPGKDLVTSELPSLSVQRPP